MLVELTIDFMICIMYSAPLIFMFVTDLVYYSWIAASLFDK
jgi:hypothetical protein